MFIGKEEVTLRAQFFELPWVSDIVSLSDLEEAEQEEILKVGIYKINNESISTLPNKALPLGSSSRTQNDIWYI